MMSKLPPHDKNSSHTLAVGGTGVLHGVSLELARRGHIVLVIARNKSRLLELVYAAQSLGGHIYPVPVDVMDTEALTTALQAADLLSEIRTK